MSMKKTFSALGVALGCTALGLLGTDAAIRAADHGDSPQVRNDTRADINDGHGFASQ